MTQEQEDKKATITTPAATPAAPPPATAPPADAPAPGATPAPAKAKPSASVRAKAKAAKLKAAAQAKAQGNPRKGKLSKAERQIVEKAINNKPPKLAVADAKKIVNWAAAGKQVEPAKTKGKAKATRKPAVVPEGLLGQVVGSRATSKKSALLTYFIDHKKEHTPRDTLIKHIYGKITPQTVGNFNTCLGGLAATLKEKKLPWAIIRERTEKGVLIGMDPKK
jgi:hypothetical protein